MYDCLDSLEMSLGEKQVCVPGAEHQEQHPVRYYGTLHSS